MRAPIDRALMAAALRLGASQRRPDDGATVRMNERELRFACDVMYVVAATASTALGHIAAIKGWPRLTASNRRELEQMMAALDAVVSIRAVAGAIESEIADSKREART